MGYKTTENGGITVDVVHAKSDTKEITTKRTSEADNKT